MLWFDPNRYQLVRGTGLQNLTCRHSACAYADGYGLTRRLQLRPVTSVRLNAALKCSAQLKDHTGLLLWQGLQALKRLTNEWRNQ
jgi:hypothetical protein